MVGFVRGFIGTTQPSDSSRLPQQLRLLDFLLGPGIALATAGGVRSPRFRRDPFIRDVASDPGRATVPCVAAPHMLPSAVATASAPATSRISWLNPTPQMITVYASPWSSPSPTQHSLPSGRYPLPGPDFHRLDPASFAWRTATPSSQWTWSGRGAGYPAPPPQIPACGLPAPGSCRRSNVIDVRGLGGPFSVDPRIGASCDTRKPALCPGRASAPANLDCRYLSG